MGTAVIRVVRWSATSIYRAGIEGEVCFDLTLFLLGSDFLSTHGCGIDLNTTILLVGGEMVTLILDTPATVVLVHVWSLLSVHLY